MRFAVIGLNHGHIYGQVEGLLRIPDAVCVAFHAVEKDLCEQFAKRHPQVPWRENAAILADPSIELVASASINAERGPLGVEVLRAGKHFFADKPPVTRLEHVEALARALEESGRQMFVFYGERMSNPLDIKAKELVDAGTIGELVHLMGLGPHMLRPETRPAWMFNPAHYGGAFNDIASHQVEWFVWMTGSRIAAFTSRTGQYGAADGRTLDDFADATLTSDNGVTGYVRVDWFTPRMSPIWGDVRGMIIGTRGTIEIRRTINIASRDETDRGSLGILITNEQGPQRLDVSATPLTWMNDIARSMRDGRNYLIPHDTLLHVMEMTVRIQQQAVRVK